MVHAWGCFVKDPCLTNRAELGMMGRRRQLKFLLLMCISPLVLVIYKHMQTPAINVDIIQRIRDDRDHNERHRILEGISKWNADTALGKKVGTTLKVLSKISRDITVAPESKEEGAQTAGNNDNDGRVSHSHEGSNHEHTDESPEYRPDTVDSEHRKSRYGYRGEDVVVYEKYENGTIRKVNYPHPLHRKFQLMKSRFANRTHVEDLPPGARGRGRLSLEGLIRKNISTRARIAEWTKFDTNLKHRAATMSIRWDEDWLANFAGKGMIDLMDMTIVGKGVIPIRIKEFVLKPMFSGKVLDDLTKKLVEELERMARIQPSTAVSYDRGNLPVDLYNLAPYLLDKLPTTFSTETKSPCWENSERSFHILCLPYFYLIGAPKSATTDLWSKLLLHPDVIRPADKEPQFWTRGNLLNGLMRYSANFIYLSKAITKDGHPYSSLVSGDGTASNFWERRRALMLYGERPDGPPYFTADLLRAVQPGAKIIIIVREPASRLYSEYLDLDSFWPLFKSPEDFHVRVESVIGHFNKCLETNHVAGCAANYYQPRIQVGMYSVHIREWMKRFPANQIIVLKTESWAQNPAVELKKVYTFLNLSSVHDNVIDTFTNKEKKNQRKPRNRRIGDMLPATRKLLNAFYQPFTEDLARFLKNEDFLWGKEKT